MGKAWSAGTIAAAAVQRFEDGRVASRGGRGRRREAAQGSRLVRQVLGSKRRPFGGGFDGIGGRGRKTGHWGEAVWWRKGPAPLAIKTPLTHENGRERA